MRMVRVFGADVSQVEIFRRLGVSCSGQSRRQAPSSTSQTAKQHKGRYTARLWFCRQTDYCLKSVERCDQPGGHIGHCQRPWSDCPYRKAADTRKTGNAGCCNLRGLKAPGNASQVANLSVAHAFRSLRLRVVFRRLCALMVVVNVVAIIRFPDELNANFSAFDPAQPAGQRDVFTGDQDFEPFGYVP